MGHYVRASSFGGLAGAAIWRTSPRLTGEKEVRTLSRTQHGEGHSTTAATTRRPRLLVSELRSQRPGRAHLIHHSLEPVPILAPAAVHMRAFDGLPAWSPHASLPQQTSRNPSLSKSDDGHSQRHGVHLRSLR